ncbi:MAG: transglycosylase SLT domain-containing protein, partial [Bacteroidota bacterium]
MPRGLIAFILAVVLILIFTSWPFRGPEEGGSPLWLGTEISPDSLEGEDIDSVLSMPCITLFMDSSLYYEGWDTLLQPRFWQQIMRLPPDTVLVNIAKNRRIIDTLTNDNPIFFNKRLKQAYEDSTKRALGMKRREELFFTHGRSHFYRFSPVLPDVDSAIKIFEAQGVDPWFAQAILLIESPGHLQYSIDGAYGAFQLMKGVAKEMGLKINDEVDEREDFEKSAIAASRLINRVCLPHTRALCRRYRLSYDEGEIWFRLLV